MICDMIFIYRKLVSTRWQWSVNFYKNRKESAIYKREAIRKTIPKHRIHKIRNKCTKQEQHIRILRKLTSSN